MAAPVSGTKGQRAQRCRVKAPRIQLDLEDPHAVSIYSARWKRFRLSASISERNAPVNDRLRCVVRVDLIA